VDNKRTSISEGKIVIRSQPDFEMGERTVPIKYLNDESEDKAGEMEDPYNLILDSPKGTQKQKDDPEKMDHYHTIRKNLVKHGLFNSPQAICLGRGFIISALSLSPIFLNKNRKKIRMNCRGVYGEGLPPRRGQALFVRSLG
jgi:hypothetical protein